MAMKAGAADYLLKGRMNPNDLERSIRYSIQNAKNIQEIQKLNIELEERVQRRTSELFEAIKKLEETNKKQRQAEAEVRKALEKERELNELKSRFVTIASHEFRTPLSTILSSASLVSKYNEIGGKEKIEKHVQRIKSSVTNLTGILNDFLSLSKLEEGIVSNHPSEFNMKELTEEVKEEMHGMIKENQEIHYEHTGPEMVFLDKQIMRNILINLVSNAIKYSEKGPIDINSEVMDSMIHIRIKDQGIGIPEEDKPFLFTRFFRANNSGNVQGTGLGLNIVKRYVELLNGSLNYDSELGKGTTFKIVIPK
jgi:two-component system sensor kinase FixL